MRILLACVALAACGSTTTDSKPESNTAKPAEPIISDAIRARVCKTEPCGDETSSIDVYRDASGAVKKLYRLYGPCSHNPGIYFDPDGTQTEIIPEKPIEPGSEEAKQFEAKHQAQVGGLTKSESISCRKR